MTLRIVGGIGRIMIACGILLLLFVVYQLWGTGLHTRAAQNDLRSTFDEQLAQADVDDPTAPEEPGKPEEPGREDPETAPPGELDPPALRDPVARLQIPAIGVDYIVLEGVDLPILNDGPGHFPETPLPGQPGNAAIAGHRTTFGAPFHRLDELQPGDEVEVTTLQGTFFYEVLDQGEPASPVGYHIVEPDALEILDDEGDDRLTLMACHPKYSAAQRIVVEAELVGAPAEATPRAEPARPAPPASTLLESDDGEWAQILAWAAVALALGLLAWAVGRRWRRWPTYLLSAPPMLVVLFFWFESLTTVLPAAY